MRNHITLTIEELTGKRRELDLLIESLTAYGRETATETPPAPAHERITTKDTKRKPKKPPRQVARKKCPVSMSISHFTSSTRHFADFHKTSKKRP